MPTVVTALPSLMRPHPGRAAMWMPMEPPSPAALLTWHPQPIPVLPGLCLVLAVGYAWGAMRLRRAGHSWPLGRSISWAAGVLSILAVTGTGLGGYGMTLSSMHMAQHMVLSMLSPILLLMGAPVTLALRALPARGRGAGVRRALLRVPCSRPVRLLASPALTLPLFIASLYGLYFTPVFDLAMRSWWGHTLMLVHFLGVGLLLFWPILAIDSVPHRSSPVLRIIELFLAMPFHAFFGVAVMMSSALVVRSFAHPPTAWHVAALGDQHVGGGIAWAFSEIPTLLVVAALFVQWSRSSEREARRHDRAAGRDGEAERLAYNRWLAALNARDVRSGN
ncbi:MAG: cytochrome c oxidase assembly protein [Oryzihumus sp.]